MTVRELYDRFERLPGWPCALLGGLSGAGLAALFLLRIGGLAGGVCYAVLLSIGLWIGFKARWVVDLEREPSSESTPETVVIEADTPVSSQDPKQPAALLDMVEIPGGSFLMGGSREDPAARDDEFPQHPVTVTSFLMSRFPVTVKNYKIVT